MNNPSLFTSYYTIISKIFNLGPVSTSWVVPGQVELITFNSSEGRYVNIICDNLSLMNYSHLTHYIATRYPLQVSNISKVDGTWVDNLNHYIFNEIPPFLTSLDQIIDLIKRVTVADDPILPPENNSTLDVNKRFELLKYLITMVGSKKLPGILITGSGGIGKSYTVLETLSNLGIKEGSGYDYVKGSKLTPVEFYNKMYENRDTLTVFDDSDTILQDDTMIGMLKSALDTTGSRTIGYYSQTIKNLGLPTKFTFSGQAIFISNISMADIDQAIKSRCLIVDLTMTRSEVLGRMAALIQEGPPKDTSFTDRSYQDAFNFLKNYIEIGPGQLTGRPFDLNLRTLIKLATVREANPSQFRELANYMLSAG
jgi:hypothetical protein